jgi:hypothetical protein
MEGDQAVHPPEGLVEGSFRVASHGLVALLAASSPDDPVVRSLVGLRVADLIRRAENRQAEQPS